jgi:hypothetical protein
MQIMRSRKYCAGGVIYVPNVEMVIWKVVKVGELEPDKCPTLELCLPNLYSSINFGVARRTEQCTC